MGFRTFIREITNHLGASTECVQKGIAPARREKRRGFLIDEFVCLGKKSRVLAGGRRGEFLYSDDKAEITAVLALLHRVRMKQSELFAYILLGEFPIAHRFLRWKTAMDES